MIESWLMIILGVGSSLVVQSTSLGCNLMFLLAIKTSAIAPTLSLWRSCLAPNLMESQGLSMSFLLLPCLLLAMSSYNDRWSLYAMIASPIILNPLSLLFLSPVAFFISIEKSIPVDPRTFMFYASWFSIYHSVRFYKSMQNVWTAGEWAMVSCMLSIAFSEITVSDFVTFHVYAIVAVSGLVGCVLGCAVASKMSSTSVKLPVLLCTPLAIVETALHRNRTHLQSPRCMNWLLGFLRENENGSSLPRAIWLVYWAVVLFAMLPAPAISRFHELAPAVVTRKWFHLMAIIMFAPVTIHAPQLMTLAYAIALSGLMILECVRPILPRPVQIFYERFLDSNKDMAGKVVVSHMALIMGCAVPLWIDECVDLNSSLLKLWGILVLGVGDSFGAVIGSACGKTKWGREQKKSIEGSLAMMTTMSLCCFWFSEPWLIAVVFTTLLEAFTSQIDNLVLPLAGATILICERIKQ